MVTVDEMGGTFEGGPDSVEWLREQRGDPEPCARCPHTAGNHGNGDGPAGLGCNACDCEGWVVDLMDRLERSLRPIE